ncbi:hypothetical protein AAMO2058_000302500 [Amorphochlora amoebiformis]
MLTSQYPRLLSLIKLPAKHQLKRIQPQDPPKETNGNYPRDAQMCHSLFHNKRRRQTDPNKFTLVRTAVRANY